MQREGVQHGPVFVPLNRIHSCVLPFSCRENVTISALYDVSELRPEPPCSESVTFTAVGTGARARESETVTAAGVGHHSGEADPSARGPDPVISGGAGARDRGHDARTRETAGTRVRVCGTSRPGFALSLADPAGAIRVNYRNSLPLPGGRFRVILAGEYSQILKYRHQSTHRCSTVPCLVKAKYSGFQKLNKCQVCSVLTVLHAKF